MPLVNINRAGIKRREVLEESRRVEKVIQDNLSLVNNKFSIVTFSAQHGVETGISNPFGDAGAPSGIQLINTDGSLAMAGATMRPLRIAEDGKLGVTVRYVPPESGSGSIGERISSFVSQSSPVSMTFNTATDVTSILVTPGIWSIAATGLFGLGTLATYTASTLWVNTVSATDTGAAATPDSRVSTPTAPTGTSGVAIGFADYGVTVAANTTYYLSGKMFAASGVGSLSGRISAVRRAPYLTGYSSNVTALFFAP